MGIDFYLDDTHYHGTAVPFELPGSMEIRFVVRLDDHALPVFHVHLSEHGEWISDDLQAADLVRAVGNEIERRDDAGDSAVPPGRYNKGEIVVNGEIINEPEDVGERAFD
jgi:hypothetical protein